MEREVRPSRGGENPVKEAKARLKDWISACAGMTPKRPPPPTAQPWLRGRGARIPLLPRATDALRARVQEEVDGAEATS